MIPPVKFVTADKDCSSRHPYPEGLNYSKMPAAEFNVKKCTTTANDRRTKIRTYRINVCGIGKLLQLNELYYGLRTGAHLMRTAGGRGATILARELQCCL
jgi:hypothetical protein